MFDLSGMTGTDLPNVTHIRRISGPDILTPGGVFVWPHGQLVTAYTDASNRNVGTIVATANIAQMPFGDER